MQLADEMHKTYISGKIIQPGTKGMESFFTQWVILFHFNHKSRLMPE